MADLLDLPSDSPQAFETWEFHTRAYLLVMLAVFYSVVDAVAKTLDTKNIALTPCQLRKVCERSAIRALRARRGRTFVLTSIDPRLDTLVTFWSNGCTPTACGAISREGRERECR